MKKRIDQILVDNGFVETKNKAQALIMAGQVFVDGQIVSKAGTKLDGNAEVSVKELFPYVSRGALKLEKAFTEFDIDFVGKTVCDIGSSTGGFTDFVLQNGAKKVFAVDVGTGQLAQKIREDTRVVVMERTDFRDITNPILSSLVANPGISSGPSDPSSEALAKSEGDPHFRKDDIGKNVITDPIDIFVCDVSFISLKKIIPKIAEIIHSFPVIPAKAGIQETGIGRGTGSQTKSGMTRGNAEIIRNSKFETRNSTELVLLIKPQFEAGVKEVSKGKGVIRDDALRQEIVEDIKNFALDEDFTVAGLVESPITGAKGNVEYLLYLKVK